jgi:hypothetical protein
MRRHHRYSRRRLCSHAARAPARQTTRSIAGDVRTCVIAAVLGGAGTPYSLPPSPRRAAADPACAGHFFSPRTMPRGWRADQRSLRSVHAQFPMRSAFRRAIAASSLTAQGRALPTERFAPPRLRARGAFRVNRSFRSLRFRSASAVSQLLAGPHSGAGRCPGAARVRGLRAPPAGAAQPSGEPVRPGRGQLWRISATAPIPLAPSWQRPAKTPSAEQGKEYIPENCAIIGL